MNSVLLDINILLDVFLARSPWIADSAAIFHANQTARIRGCVCAAALPTVFYIVRRNVDSSHARNVIGECLSSFDVIPVDRKVLELAQALAGPDFEDDVAIASAMTARLDAIVTRDLTGFAGSSIPAFSPADLLAKLPP